MPEPRQKMEVKRVLVVDDHSGVRSIVRANLEKQGFVHDEAADGVEAIRKAKQFQPDLVVLDLALPAMNGFEVAMALQRHMPNVPVVVLTMFGSTGQALAKSFGVKAIIDKSEGIAALTDCIHKVLGEQSKP